MNNTLEYKILEYLSKNEDGEYKNIFEFKKNSKLFLDITKQLKDEKYIKPKPYTRAIVSNKQYYIGKRKPLYKITLNGKNYFNSLKLLSSPIIKNVKEAPINKPDKKSSVKKFFSNPYIIGFILISIEELTLGNIWKIIISLF